MFIICSYYDQNNEKLSIKVTIGVLVGPERPRATLGLCPPVQDIEALFKAAGAEISEGAGSRVRVALGGARAVFHRPHPSPEAKRSTVRAVREFLIAAGIRPGQE